MQRRNSLVAALVLLLAAAPALALSPVNKSLLGGVAIDGYDPVAYFTDGKPVEGSADYSFEWQGATWRFASAEHRDRFAGQPERWAPQYGGYCAWAVGHGHTATIDPEAWSIVNGKLYLNYSRDVQTKWTPEKEKWIEAADRNWPRMRDGATR